MIEARTRRNYSELELAELFGDGIWEDLADRAAAAVEEGVEPILSHGRRILARRRGTRRSSAPVGEAPEMDTGELARSLKKIGKPRRTKYSVRQAYGSEHPSAGLHEFGGSITQNEKRRVYGPRPYIRPAELAAQDEVDEILEDL